MDASLRKSFFKSLNALRVAGVQEFLRDNAMYFIVWGCGFARTLDDELPPPIPRTNLLPEDIDEEEKERSGEREKRKRRRSTRLQNSVIKKERVKTRMLIQSTWANGRRF